jgi:hypothetical protein
MKSVFIFWLMILLVSGAGWCQDFGWAAGEESVFPIGWTADGTCFAYGTFDYSIMISNQGRLRIAVRNMKTDQDLWEHSQRWDEGNAGDGSGDIVPRTAAEAWNRVKNTVEPRLAKLKIVTGGPGDLTRFPIVNGDSLDIAISEQPEADYQVPYTVRAISRNLGSKTIHQGARPTGNELSLLGYFPSPDGTRIAVTLIERGFSFPFPSYYVIGCHTKNGFKKD